MMKNKNKNDASAPISNHIDQNFQYLKPNASNIQKSKVIANNQFPRTVRLSIPEMKEKAAFNESSKNIGCVTYKEPRKEQSPENLNLNSGKILSNKMKSLYVNAENEKRRSKSPFLDEKSLIDGIKNAGNYYRNMKENMQNEKKIINYENQREEKIFVKDILRGNFFKESHNKSNSVHQISYDIKNLLKNVQNQSNKSPINPNIIHHSSISQNQANMIKTMNKYSNNPENRIDNNCNQHDKERTNNLNIINYKEDIAETPFASLAKEKNQKKNLANEVPVSFFVNHLNLKNLKISSISPNQNFNYENVTKNCFDFKYVIGKGGFGKVWKVEQKKNRTLFAMKEMAKSKIISKRSVNSVMNERELLIIIVHPFIVNMVFAFQDRENLYLVMDLMTGGDLRFHIGRQRRFSEVQTKFFVACILLGLEYLHDKDIIHRDIKPENLVLDKNGYVRITDMGIARLWKPDNSSDTSGTPGYMAPEVMCRQNHTIGVDYFAVGVIAYEFMLGRRPYLGRSRKEIRDAILAKQESIKRNDVPDGWSLEAADFINKMIQRKPSNRLGCNGPREVKQHPWFKNFPWDKLSKKELSAPFRPNSRGDNFDHKQQITIDGETNEDLIQQNALLLKRNSVQKLFSGYDYEGATLPLKKDEENTRSRSSSIACAKTTINSTSSGSLIINNLM